MLKESTSFWRLMTGVHVGPYLRHRLLLRLPKIDSYK